jgi:hypothetical protein
MRGIRLIFRQQVIQAMLRVWRQSVRQFNSQAAESRGTNRDQQSGDRLALCTQISEALFDQVLAG